MCSSDLKDKTLQHRKRRSFSKDEINIILNAPIYTGCVNDERKYKIKGKSKPRRGRFWVPLLALWTGMRLGEICQLAVSDIVKKDGIYCIVTIWDEEDDDMEHTDEEDYVRTQKTYAAARLIPVHSKLVQMGFVGFVDQVRKSGHKRLFPEIKPDKKTGYLSARFSKWRSEERRVGKEC